MISLFSIAVIGCVYLEQETESQDSNEENDDDSSVTEVRFVPADTHSC